MNATKVTFNYRMINASSCIIDIQGELTMAAESDFMLVYAQANRPTKLRTIILNFGPLTYMNSSGIGLLVTFLVRLNREGQKLAAFGLNEHYERVFELTRLNEAIHVYANEDEAVQTVTGI